MGSLHLNGTKMNWLQRIARILATNLPSQVWYHGTDASTAYSLMENMLLKPREETGNSSFVGSLSSIQSSVYLTASPGKAAKHAIERAESYKSHPVILVIEPASLGYVHVDEDMVHMVLNGQAHFSTDWYPSPRLEQDIFRLAAESLRLDDYEENKSDKKLVLEYLYEKQQGWSDDHVEDEYLKEEGVVPDEQGNYEYDETMHLSKEIAANLNGDHQREAIMNFGSMAHEGRVQASEIYLIPWQIDRKSEIEWQDGSLSSNSPTSLQNYDELQQFGTQINPQQLLMSFMYKDSANWLQKISQSNLSWILSDANEVSHVGKENGSLVHNGISVYRDSYGSYRYVFYKDGEALAGIQVVSNEEKSAVANVYTKPPYRRSGLATKLFERASQDFPNLQHSDHKTDEGDSWSNSL